MAGLVADYGSSSDEETGENELANQLSSRIADQKTVNYFESDVAEEKKKSSKKIKKKVQSSQSETLINPLRSNLLSSPFDKDSSASVFFNPFHKAQQDKKQVLEKHVKMTDNPKDVLEINGKKICWNYRKGRCKFGHNCKFAHDSDIMKPSETKEILNTEQDIKSAVPTYLETGENHVLVSEPGIEEQMSKKKKRPGLSDGVIPSKKVQKLYRKQQAKETPWLQKR